ncbi:MAG: response regulator [Deltaproteobacteria bacterium]|nr:response regulator [Deltaproteobacteria bacterium]
MSPPHRTADTDRWGARAASGPVSAEGPRRSAAQRTTVGALALLCGTLFLVSGLSGNLLGQLTFGLTAATFGLAWLVWARVQAAGALLVWATCGLVVGFSTLLAIFNSGGLGAPALFALPAVPMAASWLLGRRAGVFWAIICLLPPVGLFVFDAQVPAPRLDAEALQVMHLAGPIGATLAVIAATALYEGSVSRSRAALQAALAEAERANAAKTAWLETLSHELRTPLNAVVGLSDLLEQADLPTPQRRQVELMHTASRQLLGLVGDVLDIHRIEAGQMPLAQEPLDPAQLAAEVVATLQHRAEGRGLRLRLDTEGEGAVIGDPQRLRQVLINLVGNAIKFTPQGEITVRVWLRPGSSPQHRQVELAVSDTGPGISPALQAQLFRPWAQGRGPSASREAGSGLGLHISQQLVARMGGRIELESGAGSGSTFTVSLELPACAPPAAPQPTADGPGPSAALRVLLVEDDAVSREVVAAMLSGIGCAVQVADSGPEAVRLAAAEPPEVVLMDSELPGFDGLEATRQLRALGVQCRIIALSGAARPEDRAACLAAGMDGFVSKPARLAQLRAAISAPPPAA